ncbi:MAG TPA: hypothetical protein VHL58_13275 [Thermoanaerobaculia bacterium]|nr:hypothetical protein [Thermoanaerobaculia bacterium]
MRIDLLPLATIVACVALSGCSRSDESNATTAVSRPLPVMHQRSAQLAAPSSIDTYPDDITPPPGTSYPCALTALPKSLPGIPESDRAYINRTYTRVLRATQAKLIVLKALYDQKDISASQARYDSTIDQITAAVRDDEVPSGLEPFRDDIVAALDLQRIFFRKAVPLREAGREMDEVYGVGEGHEASSRLMSAWGRMSARYPGWGVDTQDSIYHHLCALDLF